jgi:hypothetical protein
MPKTILPIQFCIDDSKFLPLRPAEEKTRAFSPLIPSAQHTYIYHDEASYYKHYADSYYGFTWKKGGWDCQRHYEIISSGAIPYFTDLADCPPRIMTHLPKKLIMEAMNLPGVTRGDIDFNVFDKKEYERLRLEIYNYAKKFLTCSVAASRILDAMDPFWTPSTKVLFLSDDGYPDYMRCQLLIGMKRLLGQNCVDVLKIEHVYNTYTGGNHRLYGKGHSYAYTLTEDPDINRDHEYIRQQIKDKYFDLVIFGSIHRGRSLHDCVMENYKPHKVAFVCGEDTHNINECIDIVPNNSFFFLREFE